MNLKKSQPLKIEKHQYYSIKYKYSFESIARKLEDSKDETSVWTDGLSISSSDMETAYPIFAGAKYRVTIERLE